MRLNRAVASLLTILLLSGCYTYVPTDFQAVRPGGSVRVQLTPEGMERIEERVGARHTSVTGEVAEIGAENLLLRLDEESGGGAYAWSLVQEVPLRPGDIHQVEAHTVHGRRTALFAAAIGGMVALSFYLVHVQDPGGSLPPTGGGTDFQWVPALP